MQNFFAEYIISMYHYIPVGRQDECYINREGLLTLGIAVTLAESEDQQDDCGVCREKVTVLSIGRV